jgi:thiamine transport system ATP-binding protein
MLRCDEVTVRYGAHVAVDRLDLEAADGEVVAVLGPSGCGKSTLLRAIAGLEPLVAGAISLDGADLAGRRPDQRDVGLMFQDHALFPHRTVADNVAFGPRMRGLPRDAVRARVAEALALVDLDGFGDRRVTELSGGEQQRVALARALAPRPRLLMLDEPLGSLDRTLRDQLLDQLPRVFAAAGCTVLYVTHDQDEALSLADRVAVMRAGRLVQTAPPDALWRAPRDGFVARFLGIDLVLEGEAQAGIAATALGRVAVPDLPDGPVELAVLPDALRLVVATPSATETGDPGGPGGQRGSAATETGDPGGTELLIGGIVTGRRFAGDHTVVSVQPSAGPLLTVPVWRAVPPEVGTEVTVALDPTRLHPLEPSGRRAHGRR